MKYYYWPMHFLQVQFVSFSQFCGQSWWIIYWFHLRLSNGTSHNNTTELSLFFTVMWMAQRRVSQD